jgi:putative ABC transport system substrate-binding protein
MVIDRRAFLASTVSVLVGPLAAAAQQAGKLWRIGLLGLDDPSSRPFVQGLRNLGWIEGQNIALDRRFSPNYDRLADLAQDLVRLHVDVIVAANAPSTRAAAAATRTIPIVMAPTGDPVSAGFVSSLARPGGNITGVAIMHPELSGKRLELIVATLPGVKRIAVLANPENPSTPAMLGETSGRARALGIELVRFEATATSQFRSLFESMTRQRVDALVVLGDPFFNRESREIVRLALRHRLAGVYEWYTFAEAGGLIAYGPRLEELRRKAAGYVDKILKGARPEELPIEQPETFDLVINLKTAKALRLTIPPSLLLRADQVIE